MQAEDEQPYKKALRALLACEERWLVVRYSRTTRVISPSVSIVAVSP